MTLPEIPLAHREAVAKALLLVHPFRVPPMGWAEATMAEMLRLGYRVAPARVSAGLSAEARETILSLLQEATSTWHGPCADDGERAEAKDQRRKISAARAEIEALS